MSESLIYRLPPNDRTMDNMIHAVTAIRGHLEGGPTILRPKQIEIVHSVADIIGLGERAAYLDLPTGIGKTVIFSQIVDAIQQDGHRKKILIVTDSQDLVLQTKERFDQHAPNVPVGMYYEKVKQTEQPVIVTTYDSFPYFAENHAHEFDYVVFDEAHKALSEARIVHRHKFDNAVWLALTATPAYSKDKALENHFALAYKMSVREAVFNGLICQYRNIRVDSRYADLSKVKISPKGNYDKYFLEQEINIYSRNRSAVEFYQYAVDPYTGIPFLGKKGIANCAGIKHAYDFADLCQELIEPHTIGGKTPCVAVHGKSKDYPQMNPKLRKSILEAHRHNEIALLSQSDLLIHGHDDKEIELALNLAPSLSLVEVQQRAGRSLRIDENNPDKVATIADFIDEETDERAKALMYGDVVGQASVLFPETEKRFFATYGGGVSGGGGRRAIQHIDHGFLKKLKVLWSSEEVDAVILKNKLKGRKLDDEMSASEIAAEEKLDSRLVSKHLKELVPLKGKKGEYIDPTDTSKKPVIYHGGERIIANGQKKRCLKREDVPKFIENCVLKDKKREDELSVNEISKGFKVSRQAFLPHFNKLKPVKGERGQYIYSEDKSKNPTIYRGGERFIQGKYSLCLKREDALNFLQNYVLNVRKQADELSATEIAREFNVSRKLVAECFDKLKQVKGREGQYIDPKDKSKDPTIYHGSKRLRPGRIKCYVLCLRREDVPKFLQNYILKDKKQEDELAGHAIARQFGLSRKIVAQYLNRLKPIKGKEGQYIDPKDKSKDPTIYYGAERIAQNGDKIRVLKKESVEPFLKNGVLKDRKQEEELSPKDIAQDAGVSAQTIQQYLSRLKPIKEKEGQYVDPEDKNGNPTIYYGAEHVVNGKKLRYLKKESVQPFLQNCVLKDRKKEDELSASDLEKIFVTTYRRALALLNGYKASKSDVSLYVHPSGKFKETVQIVTNRGKEMGSQVRCLKANSLDVFADQNGLEYRNSSKKPKLSKAF